MVHNSVRLCWDREALFCDRRRRGVRDDVELSALFRLRQAGARLRKEQLLFGWFGRSLSRSLLWERISVDGLETVD